MQTIVWDVDDVLNNLMKEWLIKEKKKRFFSISYADITENPPNKLLGISLDEYRESLDQFRLSDDYVNMSPKNEILKWFKIYGHLARHIVLTSVPLKAAHISSTWVIKYFGKWIRNISFVPSERTGENLFQYDKSKQSFLKWFNPADILVEDNQKNIDEAQEIGIKTISIAQPWNRSNLTIQDSLKKLNTLLGF